MERETQKRTTGGTTVRKRVLVTASFVLVIAGCSQSITMEAASVTRFEDGSEWVMNGELLGSLDGSSITRLSGNGWNCEMIMTRQPDRSAAGTMNCTDATGEVVYSEPQVVSADAYSMSFNGTYVSEVNTPVGRGLMAFGWGNRADADTLRTMLF
jgi:hypothetical protein